MRVRLFFALLSLMLLALLSLAGKQVAQAQQPSPLINGPAVLPEEPVEALAVPSECLSTEEAELVRLINEYRNQNGLASVPASKSLTLVAQWHVIDLHENSPNTGEDHGLACNLHSWSDKHPELWNPVCYTGDHQFASGMWNKPREITKNLYSGNGFENAYSSGGQATAAGALAGWKSSPGHNEVILEQGIWAGSNWPAMGVGIYQSYAVLWFGNQTDPAGTVTACDNQGQHSLSGRVIDNNNNPVAGVTISAGAGHTATTNNNGEYTLTNLTAGSYTLTLSKIGFILSPAQFTVVVPTANTIEHQVTVQTAQTVFLPLVIR